VYGPVDQGQVLLDLYCRGIVTNQVLIVHQETFAARRQLD
jgi:hypothetical protein